jgi:cysteine sulfinate desulfinase/cysteine desulfurase-like protein
VGQGAVRFNGDPHYGMYNTLNVTIEFGPRGRAKEGGKEGKTLAQLLNAKGVCVSAASACTMGEPSHVLAAMGLSPEDMRRTVRVSLSKDNTVQDCAAFLRAVIEVVDGAGSE